MADLSNLTVEQLKALKASRLQETKTKADTRTALSQLSTEQLQSLKQGKKAAAEATKGPVVDDWKDRFNPLIPIGAGLEQGLVGDVKLAYKQFAEATGLKEPGEAKAYEQSRQSEKLQYEASKEGKKVYNKQIAFAADVIPQIWGSKGIVGTGANMAVDATLGALSSEDNRIQGAITGLVGGQVVRGIANKVVKPFSEFAESSVGALEDAKTFAQATGSKTAKSIESILAKIPFVGTKKALQNQIDETKAAVNLFAKEAESLNPETVGAELANSMARQYKQVADLSDEMYADVFLKADTSKAGQQASVNATKDAAAALRVKLMNNADDASKTVVSKLQTILESNPRMFSETVNLQRATGQMYRDLRKVDGSLAEEFNDTVLKTLNKEVDELANKSGIGQRYNTVKRFYETRVLPFTTNSFIEKGVTAGKANIRQAQAVSEGAVTDGVESIAAVSPAKFIKKLLSDTPQEQLRPFVASLDKTGKNALKNSLIQHIYTDSIVKKGPDIGDVDLIKFNSNLSKSMKAFGLINDEVSTKTAKGLLNATEVLKRNPLLVNDRTAKGVASDVAQYAGLSTTAGALGTAGASLGAVGGTLAAGVSLGAVKAISSLMTTKTGVKLLQQLGRYSLKDPKLPGLVRDALERIVAGMPE